MSIWQATVGNEYKNPILCADYSDPLVQRRQGFRVHRFTACIRVEGAAERKLFLNAKPLWRAKLPANQRILVLQ